VIDVSKAKILFNTTGDNTTSWKGKRNENQAQVERNPNQYVSFASPWSKISLVSIDNLKVFVYK
jgi:hypothetical protein